MAGSTLAHLDCRDDNLIIDATVDTWVCDWNFPAVGPRWADAVCLAISMFGDGLDAEALLAETGSIIDDDREGIDCLLAVLTAYFLFSSERPPNPTSPYLRVHQRLVRRCLRELAEAATRLELIRRGPACRLPGCLPSSAAI